MVCMFFLFAGRGKELSHLQESEVHTYNAKACMYSTSITKLAVSADVPSSTDV